MAYDEPKMGTTEAVFGIMCDSISLCQVKKLPVPPHLNPVAFAYRIAYNLVGKISQGKQANPEQRARTVFKEEEPCVIDPGRSL